ncbi:MAG: holo-[acyl-carrier-protein] synthase [Chloroflexi bacterium]|nr:holo-[acyl-carrier-protein] synthase [Chloroflexota bacterium]
MLRTGVDIIDVARVRDAAQRHGERFYQRFFTEAELTACGQRFPSLAARIAAKEAVSKALGTGIGDVRWVEIEVVNDERGRPVLNLYGDAATLATQLGLTEWDLSLSHTDRQAIAFVVALSRTTTNSL